MGKSQEFFYRKIYAFSIKITFGKKVIFLSCDADEQKIKRFNTFIFGLLLIVFDSFD